MELYKPVIEKREVDTEHYYYVNKKFTPGVTTILSETLPTPYALRQWIGDVGNEKAEAKLNRAGERGTAIHDACERLATGETIKLHELFQNLSDQKCVVSFKNFMAQFQPEIVGIEMVVASEYGYAGTLDLLVKIDPSVILKELKMETENWYWIIDIKTSSAVYDSHKLQIAAYEQAIFEMEGYHANRMILHLNPKTIKGYTIHANPKIGDKIVTIDDFLTVMAMYKMLNGGEIPTPPIVAVYPELLNLQS